MKGRSRANGGEQKALKQLCGCPRLHPGSWSTCSFSILHKWEEKAPQGEPLQVPSALCHVVPHKALQKHSSQASQQRTPARTLQSSVKEPFGHAGYMLWDHDEWQVYGNVMVGSSQVTCGVLAPPLSQESIVHST